MGVLVAVDVGGSGLRAVVEADGVRGAVHRADGARIGVGGLNLPALIEAIRAVLSVDPMLSDGVPPDLLVFGARGVITLAGPAKALRALAPIGARRTVVCSDAVTSLVGAMGGVRPGAVVAAGTGAVAFGSDFDRHFRRVDGWGHVLGDRGSAAWITLTTLQELLRRHDGVRDVGEPGAGLWAAAVGHFGPPNGWPALVMTRPDVPEVLASFAPVVTGLAGTDATAAGVCRLAGEHLAQSLLAAADGLPGAALAATGGVLESTVVRAALDAALAAAGSGVIPAVGDTLSGALLLARHLENHALPGHPDYLLVS